MGKKQYVVNKILMKPEQLPLYLPTYHPDLNHRCGEIKGKVACQNVESSLQQKEHLLRKLFSEYSSPEILLLSKKD